MSEPDGQTIVRFHRIRSLANRTCNDAAKADQWLHKKLSVVGGRTPLAMLETADGEKLIETILAKIAWGAAARSFDRPEFSLYRVQA